MDVENRTVRLSGGAEGVRSGDGARDGDREGCRGCGERRGGGRGFCGDGLALLLPEEEALLLISDGWRVDLVFVSLFGSGVGERDPVGFLLRRNLIGLICGW